MTPRRHLAWLRLLCAVALGLGLSGAATVAATDSAHSRPAIAQLQDVVHDMAATSARAPLALGHVVHRHVPPSIGVALLATAVLVACLLITAGRRQRSTSGDGRRTSPVGARAPPVAIGN